MIEGLRRDVRNRSVFCKKKKDTTYWDSVKEEIESHVGDQRDVGIPGNISNPEVKHVNADGTWRATSWESRSLPTWLFWFNNLWIVQGEDRVPSVELILHLRMITRYSDPDNSYATIIFSSTGIATAIPDQRKLFQKKHVSIGIMNSHTIFWWSFQRGEQYSYPCDYDYRCSAKAFPPRYWPFQ